MALTSSTLAFESLFHASSIDLLIPSYSSLPPTPAHDASADDIERWWEGVERAPRRHTAFLDEKLFYLLALTVPYDAFAELSGTPAVGSEPPSKFLHFLSRLQLTLTSAFVPQFAPSSQSSSAPGTASTLAPPETPHRHQTIPDDQSHLPPVTPNPFPRMASGEARYAGVEGTMVWEGPVEEHGENGGRRVILRTPQGWVVVWRGDLPIAFVRTNIQNPLLALTASITLREHPSHIRMHKKAGPSFDTASIRSGTETIRTDGGDVEVDGDDDIAAMEDIDLLGGLADDALPSSRLAPSLRQDLSLPSYPPGSLPTTAITPAPPLSSQTPPTASSGPSRERQRPPPPLILASSNTTLRRSYRRVLSLSAGLRVRMRTLLLPQLLPVSADYDDESEGEKRIVLIVEIENTLDSNLPVTYPFEIESVTVEVGGKGAKATAELVCQPEADSVFPLQLAPVEQYNLLYGVSVASAAEAREKSPESLARGDEQRPVAITVIGAPKLDGTTPTKSFHSRWNCTLDLGPYYASLAAVSPTPAVPPARNRFSKPPVVPQNAIAGDKRYSLASLLTDKSSQPSPNPAHRPPNRIVSGTTLRPLMPSHIANAPQGQRVPSMRPPLRGSIENAGLLVSVKILRHPDDFASNATAGPSSQTVRRLEPFSLEVFVHNRTYEVRRFRLVVPGRQEDDIGHRVREVWERRKKRRNDDGSWGADDVVLRSALAKHLASAPALIPLENDIRCGPLLPGASLSARIRFLALRDGVHRIEKLRVQGAGDEFNFVLTPVVDVVVGDGVDDL
ncbi:TRAPP trafficking subunit Trs65-domain-containing protein [Naematelia encephala]|uniref:TRAPP trafficking subunit Trs65-domain-containing protein n=1 Tax=Naematelia encephala TaxID=71784 RepID=A0A1Y2BJC4_9TREE|nr:TRAPP trafficking subunit Trs65-domain-containing protein [Naematelia encephala]